MALPRRHVWLLLMGLGACVLPHPPLAVLSAQDQSPNRHELRLVARDFRWIPDRIQVSQDDLVKLTIRSEDIAYSFAIDEYRIVRRVPAGRATTFEFQANRAGTYRFYSSLTSDRAHAGMQGQLTVNPR
jgi:heme/copper-type cytochrome/quinol oxidase subunit 2